MITNQLLYQLSYSSKCLVRVEGLEPPRLAALEPKTSASTNFAIPALMVPIHGFEPRT